MISRKLSDLKDLREYYIYDDPLHPLEENQRLIRILSYLYPETRFRGYRQSISDLMADSVLLSTKPDILNVKTGRKILHVYNTEDYWGTHDTIFRLVENQLQERYGQFDEQMWGKYIQVHGRVTKDASRFIASHWRIRRSGKNGILRFIPALEKTGYHLSRERKLGISYLIDDSMDLRETDLQQISEVSRRLSDDLSRDLYHNVMFGDAVSQWKNYYRGLIELPQYIDYIKLDNLSVILNFGVGRGFEIPYFLSFDVQKIFNIDPTGDEQLSPYVREWGKVFPGRLEFIDRAVSETLAEVELTCIGDVHTACRGGLQNDTVVDSSGFGNGGAKKFRAIRMRDLVSILSLERVDLVKVDTDGGEDAILEGMDILIKKFRPQIAFSIYHRNRDFFEMPLRLMSMCPDYRFYCRTYSYEKWETVLYCIPSEVDR